MLSVSIDRSALSLAALVIGQDPTSGLWLPEDGLGRPARQRRNRYAPESPWLNGSTLLSTTLAQSSIPMTVYAQGADMAALYSLMDILDGSLSQFTYLATVTEGDVTRTWQADPADVTWSEFDSGMSAAFMARATVTIPVYPIPA